MLLLVTRLSLPQYHGAVNAFTISDITLVVLDNSTTAMTDISLIPGTGNTKIGAA
jgi:TPP-dependent indolepyruvate ferredoxin oxidoreductase alpha subunit